MTSSELFAKPTEFSLYANDDATTGLLLFPVHALDGKLPSLVAVSAKGAKTPVIAATGWWGTPGMDATADAVRANPATVRQLSGERARSEQANRLQVTVSKARPWQVLRYKRGFALSVATTLLVALAAVGSAAVGFLTGTAPLAAGAVVLLLACVAECAKAALDVGGAVAKIS